MAAVRRDRPSSAAPPAPRRRSKVRQPLRRAVIVANERRARGDRARSPTSSPASSTSRSSTSSPRPERARLLRGRSPTTARSAPASARRCRRWRPRSRPSTPRTSPSALRGGERGRDHDRRPRPRARRRRPDARDGAAGGLRARGARPATRWRWQLELDDELRREGLAREIVHAVQNALQGARAWRIADRIALGLGGDEVLLEAAREHQAYLAGEVLATEVSSGPTMEPR